MSPSCAERHGDTCHTHPRRHWSLPSYEGEQGARGLIGPPLRAWAVWGRVAAMPGVSGRPAAAILAFSPTEVVRKVNELIATGQYGRLFAVVHFASQQWKVTSEDLILINNKLDIACGERIRLEKVRPSASQGAVTKCALLPPGSSSGGFLGSAGEGEQSRRQEPGVPPGAGGQRSEGRCGWLAPAPETSCRKICVPRSHVSGMFSRRKE